VSAAEDHATDVRASSAAAWILAILAGCAAFLRASAIHPTSDDSFHLLRVGTSLVDGSLDAYCTELGGTRAPILGAWIAGLAHQLPGSVESTLRIPGTLAFASSAALLAGSVARRVGIAWGVLAACALVVPPAFAFGSVARPDAALGGTLLLAAALAWSSPHPRLRRAAAPALASIAAFATPAALGALALMPWLAPRASSSPPSARPPRERFGAALVTAITLLVSGAFAAALSFSLPSGCRLEIVRGMVTGFGFPLEGTLSAMWRLLGAWGEGLMFLATGAGAAFFARASKSRALHFFLACAGACLLLAAPDEFMRFLPALAPLTALAAALLVADIPDSGRPAPSPRVLAAALAVLASIFLLRSEPEKRAWNLESASCARMAQIGTQLDTILEPGASIAAERTGALAFYTREMGSRERARPLARVAAQGLDANATPPAVILFEKALAPVHPGELAVLRDGELLRAYAPRLMRRGPRGEIEDAIWALRTSLASSMSAPTPPPAPIGRPSSAYLVELAKGWSAHAGGHIEDAARAFAAACAAEPEGLGIAREWSGMQEAALGHADAARARFEEAIARDPATARARGHLADIAISKGDFRRADELLAEALAWNDDAETWGTAARLAVAAGDSAMARASIDRALEIAPSDARIQLNAGSIRWIAGDFDAARRHWGLALTMQPELVRYLGDFRRAKPGDPAPPLLPLFALESFDASRTSSATGGPPSSARP
jgi:tetratricopeptide (TPR) repeat protein